MLLPKIMKFLYPFVLPKTGEEKVFNNNLGRKLVFLDYKNIDLKKVEKLPFFHGFDPTFEISMPSF